MLVRKGNKQHNVSKKAYRLLYKNNGWELVDEIPLKKRKVEELKELAAEKGIEGHEDMKKEELVAALEEVM